jgi:hypothetical protein
MLPRRGFPVARTAAATISATPRTSSWRLAAAVTTTSPAPSVRPSSRSSSSFRFVPTPTWSVKEDLALHERHDIVDAATFRRLCRRACLSMPDEDDRTISLRQDVGNMMHMMNRVVEALALITPHDDAAKQQPPPNGRTTVTSNETSSDDNNNDKEAANIYDRPRGVTSAPVAVATAADNNDDDKVWLRTLRDNKMTRVGGHYYFEIEVGAASQQ